jgi:GNAT superfamily N-acetyltransferase
MGARISRAKTRFALLSAHDAENIRSTGSVMTDLIFDTDPSHDDIRTLDDRLYGFNMQATGHTDGELYAIFLRDENGAVIGGADGWTWGATCYVKHLFVPEAMRGQGLGTKLMDRIEQEALARRCALIVLETHDFQAPDFYRRRGYVATGSVEDYPRGHRNFTFVKKLHPLQPSSTGEKHP